MIEQIIAECNRTARKIQNMLNTEGIIVQGFEEHIAARFCNTVFEFAGFDYTVNVSEFVFGEENICKMSAQTEAGSFSKSSNLARRIALCLGADRNYRTLGAAIRKTLEAVFYDE